MAGLWDAYSGGFARRNPLEAWRARERGRLPFGMTDVEFRDYVARTRGNPGSRDRVLADMGFIADPNRRSTELGRNWRGVVTPEPPAAPPPMNLGGDVQPTVRRVQVTPFGPPEVTPAAPDYLDEGSRSRFPTGELPPAGNDLAGPLLRFRPRREDMFIQPPNRQGPNMGGPPPATGPSLLGPALGRMLNPAIPGDHDVAAPPPIEWSADVSTADLVPPPTTEEVNNPLGDVESSRVVREAGRIQTERDANRPPPPAQPGYLDRLMNNRAFLMGLSILGTSPGGNWGPNAVQSGLAAQRARREETEYERLQNRRTVMDRVWNEAFPNGQPNPQHPLLQNVPPEMISTIFAMGPETGLTELQKLQFFRAQRQEQLRIQQQQLQTIIGNIQPGTPGAQQPPPGQQTPPPGQLQTPPGMLQPGNLQPGSFTPGAQQPPPGQLQPGSLMAPTGSQGGNVQINRQPPTQPNVNFMGRQIPLNEAIRIAQQMDFAGMRSEALEREIAEARKDTQLPESVRTRAHQADAAFRTLSESLDRYDRIVGETGGNFGNLPSQEQDRVMAERTNIMLQLKELFNLGVLNGPDLALMERMVVDPTYGIGMWGPYGLQNLPGMDAAGRVRDNTARLREILRGIRNNAVRPLNMQEAPGDFRIERVN